MKFSPGAEMRRVLLIVGAVVFVACAKSSTAPRPADVVGTWSGPISDALLGSGTLTLSLTEMSNDSVSGTWATSFPDSTEDLAGRVAGHVTGPTLTVELKPTNPPTCQYGPFDLTGLVTGNAAMTGTFVTVQCPAADSGTFTSSKQ